MTKEIKQLLVEIWGYAADNFQAMDDTRLSTPRRAEKLEIGLRHFSALGEVIRDLHTSPDYVKCLEIFHRFGELEINKKPMVKVCIETKQLRIRLMREELDELWSAIKEEDLVKIADGIGDLLYVVFGTAVSYGIPIDQVFEAIHSANLRKFNSIGGKDNGGKVLKPIGWEGPEEDIRRILKNAKN